MQNSYFFCVFLLLAFANFYGKASTQATVCNDSCPCTCNNLITNIASNLTVELSTLNCSGVGVNSVSACGSLAKFSQIDFSGNAIVTFPAGSKVCEEQKMRGTCLLHLSHNNIENFHLSYEDNGTDVSSFHIDLSYNRLSTPGTLVELGQIGKIQYVTINVSHNLISYIQEGFIVFHPSSIGLEMVGRVNIVIDLSHNNIANHYQSSLYNTPITVPSLNVNLHLQHNRITTLKDFFVLKALLIPYFAKRTRLFINMGYNHITSANRTDLFGTRGLSMNLQENPWNCDCRQRWIASESSNIRRVLSRKGSVQPFCNSPSSVKKRPLLSLSEDDFICPPQRDVSVPTTIHPSKGDTVELFCPVTPGDPPFETVKWNISQETALQQSSVLSLETIARSPLVINSMDHDWEGSYTCTVDNGVQVSSVITVDLADVAHRVEGGASSVLDPPHPKGRLLKGAVIFLSFLMAIATIIVVALCYMHYRSRDSQENREVVQSNLTEPRLLNTQESVKISNNYSLQQQLAESQKMSTKKNNRENSLDYSNDIIYENARHTQGLKREQPGRDVKKKTGSEIISVKYDEGMQVYYNVSPTSSLTTDKSGSCCEATNNDGIEYTELNMHEMTKLESEAYQSITLPSE